jgi:predicted DNA-binding protein YlxM (UPF0122 family)
LLEKVHKIGLLLDTYGNLLTERQRNFVKLHYLDDYSFGEIAKDYNISRQAVYDAVRIATKTMEDFEEKLGLVNNNPVNQSGQGADSNGRVREMLVDLRDSITREGIIYDTDSIAKRIDEIVAYLG